MLFCIFSTIVLKPCDFQSIREIKSGKGFLCHSSTRSRVHARASARAPRALRARGAAPSRFLANFSPPILPQLPPRRKPLFTKNLQMDLYNLLDKFHKQDYN